MNVASTKQFPLPLGEGEGKMEHLRMYRQGRSALIYHRSLIRIRKERTG